MVVRIARTADMEPIRRLGVANGLDDSGRGDEQVLAAWAARDGDVLAGAIVLERYLDYDTLNWMVVAPDYRGRGIAARLLAELEGEARSRGLHRLWVQARAPGFFLRHGYAPAPPGHAGVLLQDCRDCGQYGRGCEPQALMKELD